MPAAICAKPWAEGPNGKLPGEAMGGNEVGRRLEFQCGGVDAVTMARLALGHTIVKPVAEVAVAPLATNLQASFLGRAGFGKQGHVAGMGGPEETGPARGADELVFGEEEMVLAAAATVQPWATGQTRGGLVEAIVKGRLSSALAEDKKAHFTELGAPLAGRQLQQRTVYALPLSGGRFPEIEFHLRQGGGGAAAGGQREGQGRDGDEQVRYNGLRECKPCQPGAGCRAGLWRGGDVPLVEHTGAGAAFGVRRAADIVHHLGISGGGPIFDQVDQVQAGGRPALYNFRPGLTIDDCVPWARLYVQRKPATLSTIVPATARRGLWATDGVLVSAPAGATIPGTATAGATTALAATQSAATSRVSPA